MTKPSWPPCFCGGIQVEGFGRCVAHLNSRELDQFLDRLGPGEALDARGVPIDENLLVKLTKVAPILGELNLSSAKFDAVGSIGPVAVNRLILDGARFSRPVQIDVDATLVSCVGTQFRGGVTLRVRYAAINAAGAVFGSTSSISRGFSRELSVEWLSTWCAEKEAAGVFDFDLEDPLVVSLRGSDLSNLVLVNVDLSWCLFIGAYRLDQLRLEGQCRFRHPPNSWRWTRRQMLAEEYLWRGFRPEHPFLPVYGRTDPERLAVLYRSLRKAFEDSKNEAGAGDFYYGEMEARRHSVASSRAERLILWFYWLLSGYGQRAVRAFAAIVGLILVVSVLLLTVGLPGEQVWTWARVDQGVRIALGAVVFRDAGQQLTSAGAWTVMIARFLGPVLLALGVLAVRARVKR